MRHCSESIAQLAAALAKAQIELVNPVKTLTGVIDRWGSGAEGQSYRYAPLSAGLDIVRSTLCKHELAVIQTTELDQDSAMVLLTTTLAHGSGEWVSASWPVCRTADMSNPKLMGAALTYARRYGLFTLVGIAGEDDLDAPELMARADTPTVGQIAPQTAANGAGPERAGVSASPEPAAFPREVEPTRHSPDWAPASCAPATPARRRGRPPGSRNARQVSPGANGSLASDLLAVQNPDDLFRWALRALPARNKLDDTARAVLDSAFLARAEELGADAELLVAFAPAVAPGRAAPFPPAEPF